MIARRDDGSCGDGSFSAILRGTGFFEVRVICYLFIIEFRLIPETENEKSWGKVRKEFVILNNCYS